MRNLYMIAIAACFAGCTVGDTGGTATMKASSAVNGFMGGTVTGTGTFEEGASGQPADSVTLTLTINNCVAGKMYPAHIHQGSECTDTTTQGGHWDMTRGEGIPLVTCNTTTGTVTYTRPATDPTTAWSVGGDATTNVIGHLIVFHDPDTTTTRIGCGKITAAN